MTKRILAGEWLRLVEGTTADAHAERTVFACGPKRFAIGPLAPTVASAMSLLAAAGGTHADLIDHVGAEAATLAQLDHVLSRLIAKGWLERTVRMGQVALVSFRPRPGAVVGEAAELSPASRVRLSRFALARADVGAWVVESPRTPAVVVVHDPRVAGVIASLSVPRLPADIDGEAIGLDGGAVEAIVEVLAEAGLVVVETAEPGGSDEQRDQALVQWGFADLVFHAASRYGRHAGGYGGTFPLAGRFDPLPARKPLVGRPIPLTLPNLGALRRSDPTFTAVMERRRTIRAHDEHRPITLSQLGDFLYRSAGAWADGGERSDGGQSRGTSRPYPSGGGLYELELYPVVASCQGLEPGLYHYDPIAHRLGLMSEMNPAVRGLLDDGRARSLMRSIPQVLVVVAARFGRVMFKYEAMAYAAILKNVGVLYQSMYCVATAMGLAPCALGGGDSDAFASAASLDYYAETSVGEFLIGSVGCERPAPSS